MSWKENCIAALEAENLFENSGHLTRFKELLDCYSQYPFFSKGLCKCMYMSAWDEEHFAIMLQILMEMALGKEKDTEEMRLQGDSLAEENEGGEYYMYQLSNAFLDGREFRLEEGVQLEPRYRYILDRGLEAARVIDSL